MFGIQVGSVGDTGGWHCVPERAKGAAQAEHTLLVEAEHAVQAGDSQGNLGSVSDATIGPNKVVETLGTHIVMRGCHVIRICL